jgi:hypothetical protein
MNYPRIKNLVKNSAAFRLFKKDYAAFIISFLYTEFKVYDQLTVEAEAFARTLKDTIESFKEENFGTMDIYWEDKEPYLELRIISLGGKEEFYHKVKFKEIE